MTTNDQRREEWAREQIARSTRFTASMFIGRPTQRFDTREAESLADARQLAQAIRDEHGSNYGRRVLIYAITPDNVSVLIDTL